MALQIPDKILFPKTLSDCLNWYKRRPGSVFLAGASSIPEINPDEYFLSLHFIDELKRIFRGDRHLELGSMVSLNRTMKLLTDMVHPSFTEYIAKIDTAPLRNQASLGGNVVSQGPHFTLFPYLGLIDTKIELRKSGASRWIPLLKLDPPGKHTNGELITRFRIPLGLWNWQRTHSINNPNSPYSVALFMIAQVHNGIIEDFRSAIVIGTSFLLRDRSFDAELVGQNLPLNQKEANQLADDIVELLEETAEDNKEEIVKKIFTDSFIKEQIQRYYRYCLVQPYKQFIP